MTSNGAFVVPLSPVGSVGAGSRRDDEQALVHAKEEPGTAGQVANAGRRHEPSAVRPGQGRRDSARTREW